MVNYQTRKSRILVPFTCSVYLFRFNSRSARDHVTNDVMNHVPSLHGFSSTSGFRLSYYRSACHAYRQRVFRRTTTTTATTTTTTRKVQRLVLVERRRRRRSCPSSSFNFEGKRTNDSVSIAITRSRRGEKRRTTGKRRRSSSFVAQNAEQWRTDVVPWNASRRVVPTGYRLRSSSFLPILEPTARRRWRRRRPPRSRNGAFTDILSTDAHIFPSAPILFSPRFFRLGCPSTSFKRRVFRSIFFYPYYHYYRFVRSRSTSFFVRIIRDSSKIVAIRKKKERNRMNEMAEKSVDFSKETKQGRTSKR